MKNLHLNYGKMLKREKEKGKDMNLYARVLGHAKNCEKEMSTTQVLLDNQVRRKRQRGRKCSTICATQAKGSYPILSRNNK